MISPTSTPQYFGTSSTSSTSTTSTSKGTLDKNSFLTLLVAQLKNQDPDSPMQPYELAAQLAQFTSVEQLTNLNAQMTTATQASQQTTLASQSALSASLVGRTIEAVGDQVTVVDGTPTKIACDIGNSGGTATLTLKDDAGNTVATRALGRVQGGTGQTLTLPNDLPSGSYHYTLDVVDTNKAAVAVTTYISGTVSSVEFKSGQIVLRVNGLDVPLTDLVSIGGASSTGTTTGSGTTVSPRPIQTPETGPIGISTPTGDLYGLKPITFSN